MMFNSQVLEQTRVENLQNVTLSFVNEVAGTYLASKGTPQERPLIVLDHIPFYKPAGFCVDAPVVKHDKDGFIESQNMLSLQASSNILRLLPVMIFNGHDHNGCFYEHEIGGHTVKE